MPNGERILQVRNLTVSFATEKGPLNVIEEVSFSVEHGRTLGLVGESGCGKSVTAMSIIRLLPSPPSRVESGRILFNGQDLLKLNDAAMRSIRGNRIGMIFQEPMTSLNPVYTLGHQIAEVYMEHQAVPKKEALDRAKDMLDKLRIPAPAKRIYEYPHNLSGGMRQRVMIAMALACNPQLILADEPTTALDVTIQAQILELTVELQRSLSTSILLITHNLGIVAEYAQRVIVMYAGKIVEEAPVIQIFEEPLHPYTIGLLNSIPKLGSKAAVGKRRLNEIPGMVPSLNDLPQGCSFHPRCAGARSVCSANEPEIVEISPGRRIACWAVADGWS